MKNINETYTQSVKTFENIRTDSIKKIYFMGIKGVGVTALALVAKQAGFEVSGCDVEQEFITDKTLREHEIQIDIGFDPHYLEQFVGGSHIEEILLIITGAHNGFENPVAQWGKNKGIQTITQGEAVGIFMEGAIFSRKQRGISIAGSHGKTTISGMTATLLQTAGLDPSYIIGTSEVFSLEASGHFGKGDLFVSEADEYASDIHHDLTPKIFYQHPSFVILNNVDFDHPDFYGSIDEVNETFDVFVQNLREDSMIFINGDDLLLQSYIDRYPKKVFISYGLSEKNDIFLKDFIQCDTTSEYLVYVKGEYFGKFSMCVPGIHNALNSLSVIGLGRTLGLSTKKIQDGIRAFKGSKRRSEIIGKTANGAVIIDDYAHHPKEIQTTLASIKGAYPTKKIVCVFQPHTYSRTKTLLFDFASSFPSVDELILMPVFASAREKEVSEDIGHELFDLTTESGQSVKYLQNAKDVLEYIIKYFDSSEYLIITMGAGNVYKIGEKLKSWSSRF